DLDLWEAPLEAWRECAKNGAAGANLGIAATPPLEICRARLRRDSVFRDSAHHFTARFDAMLAELAPDLDDGRFKVLAQTRSAKCFRLVGCALGAFPIVEALKRKRP
ncbi:hypothetical protein, partial [Thiohalocapsa sp.]|uniref:hypothetical protein n=1 Tax=Thiohalocapsa sp. TaxID=2497641 RepID=UPI0025F68ECC